MAGRCSRIHSPTRRATLAGIISVRHGAASTWQWRQVWLHLRPTLIWSVRSAAQRETVGREFFVEPIHPELRS